MHLFFPKYECITNAKHFFVKCLFQELINIEMYEKKKVKKKCIKDCGVKASHRLLVGIFINDIYLMNRYRKI